MGRYSPLPPWYEDRCIAGVILWLVLFIGWALYRLVLWVMHAFV